MRLFDTAQKWCIIAHCSAIFFCTHCKEIPSHLWDPLSPPPLRARLGLPKRPRLIWAAHFPSAGHHRPLDQKCTSTHPFPLLFGRRCLTLGRWCHVEERERSHEGRGRWSDIPIIIKTKGRKLGRLFDACIVCRENKRVFSWRGWRKRSESSVGGFLTTAYEGRKLQRE